MDRNSSHPSKKTSVVGLVILSLLLVLVVASPAAAQSDELILVLTADGPVTPAMQDYLSRGLAIAAERNARLVVFALNTPGGMVDTMNAMVQEIRSSTVPVVVYVSPRGAMAGSAGTILTLAGHASAMAPETIIGAASPITSEGEDLEETARAKLVNAMIATIESLTENRPQEARRLAIETVTEAKAVAAQEAIEVGMVDILADDLGDLLVQLDGRTVNVKGEEITLRTLGILPENLPMSFIEQVLLMLTDPNLVFVLMSLGSMAVLIELSTPGGWVAGFFGVICLALAAYGLGVLNVNWFGLFFIALAFILFVLEVKTPAIGALTAAGVGSLIAGGLILFNSPGTPEFQRISIPTLILVATFTAASFLAIVSFALRAQRLPVQIGSDVRGRQVLVRSTLAPQGTVFMDGELWSAELEDPNQQAAPGEQVEIVEKAGNTLRVKK
jgi:membrane-bound serine protease (ClpP class)